MQEVLPEIIKSWENTANQRHQVSVVNIEKKEWHTVFKRIIKADNIVFSCYTPELFKLAKILRFKMGLNSRFIVHLFNHSTIACWPMRYFGGENIFRSSDIFISSCSRDRRCLKLTFPQANSVTIPFILTRIFHEACPMKMAKIIPFIFIGRLASQKQLHTLLFSFFLLKKKHPEILWKLKLVGEADNFGSPNMGIVEKDYLNELKRLCEALSISDRVEFVGQQSRGQINRILAKNRYIFTSASLHSDENFGIAAFQALMKGHLAVLSDWGGHSDFKLHFRKQVFLCPVKRTSIGPAIQAHQLCSKLVGAIQVYGTKPIRHRPDYYKEERITQMNLKLALSPQQNGKPLRASRMANQILIRARHSIKRKEKGKKNFSIFSGYDDPIAKRFFEVYGMKFSLRPRYSRKLILQPWVVLDETRIHIYDTHKGYRSMVRRAVNNATSMRIRTFEEKDVFINSIEFKWLNRHGYVDSI